MKIFIILFFKNGKTIFDFVILISPFQPTHRSKMIYGIKHIQKGDDKKDETL